MEHKGKKPLLRKTISRKKEITIPIKKMPVAEGEKAFWVNFGPIIHSLEELATALQRMNEKTFNHHVTKDRNDFARWVEEVLNDSALAKKLKSCDSKTCCASEVGRHIRLYY